MPEIDLPNLKDRLWHNMQQDLARFVPEILERNRLMCCACGRFLPSEDFSIEHIIPKQTIKQDPQEVRSNPATPANIRAGNILLCTKPLHYRNTRIHNNGCNSWKGKYFDGALTDIMTGKMPPHQNKKAQNAHIIGGLAAAYLAMVSEYGYVVALMQSGLIAREQFFNPNRFRKGLMAKSQMILTGQPQTAIEDQVWSRPFHFEFHAQSCLVTVRNFVVYLPISQDPRLPIIRHLQYVPQKYAFRPNFETVFT
ncbi:MAG: hypothetical protein HZA66_14010 [Rhodopseudomonas palustris]|uniref:HNH endonuclease n=1 Tax=Rhodopseudomonas palustris TaxID=1076 RepID=A0A933VW48_RHOPL|nr:hypothetical protein [Rhodopseudomonas palustris]